MAVAPAAAGPENMMTFIRPIAGRPIFFGRATVIACGALAALLSWLSSGPGKAAEQFPFDRELLLDAAPMRPAKRMPILNVAPNGEATIDLWCRSVPARVELSDAGIKIEPGPLHESLPEMMSDGQCTPQRMLADDDMLAALSLVTAWRKQGSAVVLVGPTVLTFRPATN